MEWLRLARISVEVLVVTYAVWVAFLVALTWFSSVHGQEFMVILGVLSFLQALYIVVWLEERWTASSRQKR